MDRAVALRRLLKSESFVACKVAVRRGQCCERQEISPALKVRRRGSPALWHETKSTHYNGTRRHRVQAGTDARKDARRGNVRRSGEELTGKRPEAAGASRVFLPVLSRAHSDEIEPPSHRHARACRGHPRLACGKSASKAWMAGTSPAMTPEKRFRMTATRAICARRRARRRCRWSLTR